MLAFLHGRVHMRVWALTALPVVALFLFGSPVWAQALHPNLVTFRPSIDHDANDRNGRAVLQRYELEIYRVGVPQPVLTIDLGKPAVDDDGYVRASIEERVNVAELVGQLLEARIAAVGLSGTSRSPVSNVFDVDTCRYVTPGSVEIGAAGGAVNTAVHAADGCAWRAGAAGFPHVEEPAGSGNADLHISGDTNQGPFVRVGNVSVGSQLILVFQPAAQ